MKTKPLFLFFITTIFLAVIFIISCKKQANTTSDISTDDNLSVKFARKYFYNTLRKVSINNLAISSIEDKANAKIYPFWQEAYSSTTDKYSFIEVPITSTKAPFILYSFTGKDEPKRVSDKSILDISFKRLVMYKNKAGVINERIITYLPDRAYALKHHNDVSHNHINNLDKDFTGYLEYSNWDLKRLFVLRLVNGVVVRRADLRSEVVRLSTDLTINALDNDKLKTNQTCETFQDPIYQETCYTAPDPSSPSGQQSGCNEDIVGYNTYEICTPDFCDDPANFNTAECGGDTGGGGGGGGGDTGGGGNGGPTPTLNKIYNSNSTLTGTQKDAVEGKINSIISDCIGSQLYNSFANSVPPTTFTFQISTAIPNNRNAAYIESSGEIWIKDPATVGKGELEEEFFHAYQNKFGYSGGIGQYSTTNHANIEFEARVMQDIEGMVSGMGSGSTIPGTSYSTWLLNVTNFGSAYPTSFTSGQMTDYFSYLSQWSSGVGFSTSQIGSLQPLALFSLASSSSCPTQ